jgi:hypothetical protein
MPGKITHGLDPDQVERLGKDLQNYASELREALKTLEKAVNNAAWVGKDANDFKGPWWQGHKNSLKDMAEQLHGFGQSALNNATEQRKLSNRS